MRTGHSCPVDKHIFMIIEDTSQSETDEGQYGTNHLGNDKKKGEG